MNIPNELQPTTKIDVSLPNGTLTTLPVCRTVFQEWIGTPVDFDYGKKPLLNFKEGPCFAELLILHTLLAYGWDGVWVEAYGGTHFLRSMPKSWDLKSFHVAIPEDKKILLEKIRKIGGTSACFDVMVWHGDVTVFFESKRLKKDKLTQAQLRFIEGALECGIPRERLIIVEWTMA